MAKEKNVIDIADYFTTSREKEGTWYELQVNGQGIGIEFHILGSASDKTILAAEEYRKEHELVEKEKDSLKKVDMERDAVVKRISAVVDDVRAKDGNEILINGKPLSYSPAIIREILWESIELRTDILKATATAANFQKRKK